MKILILSRYESHGASSRHRFYQYLPYLRDNGWSFTIKPLLSNNYINYLYAKGKLPFIEILTSYLQRIALLLYKAKFDIIWIQQEAFPWLPAWFETLLLRSKTPIVVDYDDAFFHRYDRHSSGFVRSLLGHKIDRVMAGADLVVVGNKYLANRAIQNNSQKVKIIPTVVDIDRYQTTVGSERDSFTIGWIGSPHTAKYLKTIEPALKEIFYEDKTEIVLIGSGNIEFSGFFPKIKTWNETTEVTEIQKFDVGIMPLIDSPWERGKCGFKLIQYLACGKPVIGSPVGVNSNIVKMGENGFLAKDNEEWIKYFRILKENNTLRKEMGIAGRKLVEEKYSLQKAAPKLIDVFEKLILE